MPKTRDKKTKPPDRCYATLRSPVEIGCIVSDKQSTIRVEQVSILSRVYSSDGYMVVELLDICYYGTRLTKKGVPSKSGAKGKVYHTILKSASEKEQK